MPIIKQRNRILLAALLLLAIRCASTSPASAIEQRTNAYAHAVRSFDWNALGEKQRELLRNLLK